MNTHTQQQDVHVGDGLIRAGEYLGRLCSGEVELACDKFIASGCSPQSDDLAPFLTRAFCAVTQKMTGDVPMTVQTLFLKNPSRDFYQSFTGDDSHGPHNDFVESEVLHEVGNVICSAVLSEFFSDQQEKNSSSLPELQHGSYEVLLTDCGSGTAARAYLVNAVVSLSGGGAHRDRLVVVCFSGTEGGC